MYLSTLPTSACLRFGLLAVALLFSCRAQAQVCGGNLGENIFTAGDFGSGVPNIIPVDPGIAPGFIYQTTPPPNDGFYTITNDMRRWSFVYPTWESFPDNSDDPNGYMMIVNAAFEPGLFYEQRVEGLCDNTLYQFSADVRNVLRPGSNNLLPNVSFLLNGNEEFTTGPITETGQWETYGFTFTTAPGQTTVTLALRNNAPGGFGNDLALDNIAFRACGPEASIDGPGLLRVCEDQQGGPSTLTANIVGDQYDDPRIQWQQSFDEGETWVDLVGETALTLGFTERASGSYYYRFQLANGTVNLGNVKCRVVSNVKVVEVVPKRYEIIDTLCQGLTFTVGTEVYASSGTSVDTLLSSLGCDSIVTLRLTVVPDPELQPDFEVVDPSCSYLSDGRIGLRGVAGGAGPYAFALDSLRLGVGSVVTALGEADYDYTISDRYGCATSGLLELRSPNPFAVELGADRVIALGEGVRLTTGGAGGAGEVAGYAFSPAGVVDCTEDCEGLIVFPAESVLLRLTATSTRGCVADDSVNIVVIKDRLVYPPTAFSPNGDGVNDAFTLFAATPNVTELLRLEIFDRWGGLVYSGTQLAPNDISAGWDGRVRGVPAAAGTYFYQAEVLFLDGEVLPFRGDFVLLR